MQLFITKEKSTSPELIMQDSHYATNFKCFNYAVDQSLSSESYEKYCTKTENIVYFKLNSYSVQDVNSVPNRNYDVEWTQFPEDFFSAAANMTDDMKVNRKVTTSRYQRIGREKYLNPKIVDYETLWAVSFSLE